MNNNSSLTLSRLLQRPLVAVAGFSFVMNLLLLAPALFMLQVFDRVLSSGSQETLLVLLVGVLLALMLSLLLDHVRSRLQGVAGTLLSEALLPDVARRVLATAAGASGQASAESLRDVAALRGVFSAPALIAVFDAPWIFVYVGVIWLAHPVLGAAAAMASLAMLALAFVTDRVTRTGVERLQREASAAHRFLEGSIANAEVAQAMGMVPALLSRWSKMNGPVLQLQQSTARRSVFFAALTRTFRQCVQVGILAVGAYLVITQSATAGVMVATTILLGRALAPVEQIVGSWKLLVEGRVAYRRLREIFSAAASEAEAMQLPAPAGALAASNVILRAPGSEKLILGGVSLALDSGESLVITGPSGAGKSTLIRLLAGLWLPTMGVVRLDGADIAQWPREALGPHIGYLPQDVELFAGSVADNIARLGEVDASAVVAAAEAARVHEMILSLPAGYDTQITPRSTVLSPGQRQRIALARALYGNPRLLLLDEPNSNLDGAGEEALGAALATLRGRLTIVMVTHRPSLVQHADKMVVLDAGRIRHFGTVSEVLQAMRSGSVQAVTRPRAQETA